MIKRAGVQPDPTGDRLAEMLGAVVNLNDTMGQVVTGMKSRNAVRQMGCETRPIYPGAPGLLSASPGVIAGINLRETAGTATVVRILDAVDPGPVPGGWSAAQLITVPLPADGSIVWWTLPGGISYVYGLYVVLAGGGTVEGAVYTGPTAGVPR